MKERYSEGEVSEWNEGQLKSLRLHEAQEIINISKINPLGKAPNGKWHFENWISGIDILFGEGDAKWGVDERDEIIKEKELIIFLTNNKPVYHSVIDGNGRTRFIFNYQNWEVTRKLIELYESRVKYYNDRHGLSTRNKQGDALGL